MVLYPTSEVRMYVRYPHISFCLEHRVMRESDVARLIDKLLQRPRIAQLAEEFGVSVVDMAHYALDAGLCFLRVVLLASSTTGETFSPPPIPDEGWDSMADHEVNPEEEKFYAAVCGRMCEVLGVPYLVPQHVRITPLQQVFIRDTSNLHGALQRYGLPYVPEHWPAGNAGCKVGDTPNPCIPLPPDTLPPVPKAA